MFVSKKCKMVKHCVVLLSAECLSRAADNDKNLLISQINRYANLIPFDSDFSRQSREKKCLSSN